MNISHKLTLPALQRECLTFLLTHAAGKPIKAMRIAELFEEEELYRESSRFVLDNPGGWTEQELSTLSPETLLKLEKRSVYGILHANFAFVNVQLDGRGFLSAFSSLGSLKLPRNTNVYAPYPPVYSGLSKSSGTYSAQHVLTLRRVLGY